MTAPGTVLCALYVLLLCGGLDSVSVYSDSSENHRQARITLNTLLSELGLSSWNEFTDDNIPRLVDLLHRLGGTSDQIQNNLPLRLVTKKFLGKLKLSSLPVGVRLAIKRMVKQKLMSMPNKEDRKYIIASYPDVVDDSDDTYKDLEDTDLLDICNTLDVRKMRQNKRKFAVRMKSALDQVSEDQLGDMLGRSFPCAFILGEKFNQLVNGLDRTQLDVLLTKLIKARLSHRQCKMLIKMMRSSDALIDLSKIPKRMLRCLDKEDIAKLQDTEVRDLLPELAEILNVDDVSEDETDDEDDDDDDDDKDSESSKDNLQRKKKRRRGRVNRKYDRTENSPRKSPRKSRLPLHPLQREVFKKLKGAIPSMSGDELNMIFTSRGLAKSMSKSLIEAIDPNTLCNAPTQNAFMELPRGLKKQVIERCQVIWGKSLKSMGATVTELTVERMEEEYKHMENEHVLVAVETIGGFVDQMTEDRRLKIADILSERIENAGLDITADATLSQSKHALVTMRLAVLEKSFPDQFSRHKLCNVFADPELDLNGRPRRQRNVWEKICSKSGMGLMEVGEMISQAKTSDLEELTDDEIERIGLSLAQVLQRRSARTFLKDKIIKRIHNGNLADGGVQTLLELTNLIAELSQEEIDDGIENDTQSWLDARPEILDSFDRLNLYCEHLRDKGQIDSRDTDDVCNIDKDARSKIIQSLLLLSHTVHTQDGGIVSPRRHRRAETASTLTCSATEAAGVTGLSHLKAVFITDMMNSEFDECRIKLGTFDGFTTDVKRALSLKATSITLLADWTSEFVTEAPGLLAGLADTDLQRLSNILDDINILGVLGTYDLWTNTGEQILSTYIARIGSYSDATEEDLLAFGTLMCGVSSSMVDTINPTSITDTVYRMLGQLDCLAGDRLRAWAQKIGPKLPIPATGRDLNDIGVITAGFSATILNEVSPSLIPEISIMAMRKMSPTVLMNLDNLTLAALTSEQTCQLNPEQIHAFNLEQLKLIDLDLSSENDDAMPRDDVDSSPLNDDSSSVDSSLFTFHGIPRSKTGVVKFANHLDKVKTSILKAFHSNNMYISKLLNQLGDFAKFDKAKMAELLNRMESSSISDIPLTSLFKIPPEAMTADSFISLTQKLSDESGAALRPLAEKLFQRLSETTPITESDLEKIAPALSVKTLATIDPDLLDKIMTKLSLDDMPPTQAFRLKSVAAENGMAKLLRGHFDTESDKNNFALRNIRYMEDRGESKIEAFFSSFSLHLGDFATLKEKKVIDPVMRQKINKAIFALRPLNTSASDLRAEFDKYPDTYLQDLDINVVKTIPSTKLTDVLPQMVSANTRIVDGLQPGPMEYMEKISKKTLTHRDWKLILNSGLSRSLPLTKLEEAPATAACQSGIGYKHIMNAQRLVLLKKCSSNFGKLSSQSVRRYSDLVSALLPKTLKNIPLDGQFLNVVEALGAQEIDLEYQQEKELAVKVMNQMKTSGDYLSMTNDLNKVKVLLKHWNELTDRTDLQWNNICLVLVRTDINKVSPERMRSLKDRCLETSISLKSFGGLMRDLLEADLQKYSNQNIVDALPEIRDQARDSDVRDKAAMAVLMEMAGGDGANLDQTAIDFLGPLIHRVPATEIKKISLDKFDKLLVPLGSICKRIHEKRSLCLEHGERFEECDKIYGDCKTSFIKVLDAKDQVINAARKRRDADRVTECSSVTCTDITLMAEAAVELTETQLELCEQEFNDCASKLGSLSGLTQAKRDKLALVAEKFWGVPSGWSSDRQRQAGSIASGLKTTHIQSLTLVDINAAFAIGKHGGWEKVRLQAMFMEWFKDAKNQDATTITATELQSIQHLICGASTRVLDAIHASVIVHAVQKLGEIGESCDLAQLQSMAKKVISVHSADVKTWDVSLINSIGVIVGGLDESKLQSLTESQIQAIPSKVVSRIPAQSIGMLTSSQVSYLTNTQAARLTASQLITLSQADKLVIEEKKRAVATVYAAINQSGTISSNQAENKGSGRSCLPMMSVMVLCFTMLALY